MNRLIDKYLPQYDFYEVHSMIVGAIETEIAYKATKNLDLAGSRISRTLIRLRGLPAEDLTLTGFTHAMKFTLLEDKPPEEFIYGFWLKNGIAWVLDNEEFIHDSPKGTNAKVVWHFSFEPEDGHVRVRTETRIQCLNRKTKFWFGLYWFFIRPFSGLIRLEMLRLIRQEVKTSR